MNIISQGKIFLSDQRGIIESDRIKRYSTFNVESFYNPAKEAIGSLYALHDDILAPNSDINFYTREQGYVFIVPITGDIRYVDEQKNETSIEVGNSLLVYLDKNSYIQLKNPYEEETINYVMVALKCEETPKHSLRILPINLSEINHLDLVAQPSPCFKISIGRFRGRGESEYPISRTSTLYCFVLAGAFEIDGRLLHDRDGIALSATEKIEMEALSDNAMLLTIEIAPKVNYILF